MTCKTTNKIAVCIFCRDKAIYYNSEIDRYTCTKDYRDCRVWPTIEKHIKECDLPKELHSIYPSHNKCFQLQYDILVARGSFGRYDEDKLIKRILLQRGEAKCYTCGGQAHYISNDRYSCAKSTKECPGYNDYIKFVHKEKYRKNPELRIKMSHRMKEVQNRDSVKNKKRDTMILLHNADCDKCIEFQKHYRDGKPGRRFNDKKEE